MGWEANRVTRMRRAVAILTRSIPDPPAGGESGTVASKQRYVVLGYDEQYGDDGLPPPVPHWVPGWVRQAVGEDHFRRVKFVSFSSGSTLEDWDAIEASGTVEAIGLMSHPGLTAAEATRLAGCSSLRSYVVWQAPTTDAMVDALVSLPKLREIYLAQSEITDQGLRRLGAIPTLRSFSLWGMPQTAECLAGAVKLEKLALTGTAAANFSLVHLQELTNLQVLELTECDAVDESGLVHLRKLRHLRELRIGRLRLTKPVVALLASFPRLEKLEIDSIHYDQTGSSAEVEARMRSLLDRIGPDSPLTTLRLPTSLIVDNAFLATVGRLTHLRHLRIDGPGITDDGLKHLATLTNLEELTIGNHLISDAGLKHLTGFKHLQT